MQHARSRTFRQDFDPARDFVALRGFVYSAQGHVPGQPLVKKLFTVRRLKQLYDMRSIGYPEDYWGALGVQPMNGAPALPEVPEGPETETVAPVEAVKGGGGTVPRRKSRRLVPRRHAQKGPTELDRRRLSV